MTKVLSNPMYVVYVCYPGETDYQVHNTFETRSEALEEAQDVRDHGDYVTETLETTEYGPFCTKTRVRTRWINNKTKIIRQQWDSVSKSFV